MHALLSGQGFKRVGNSTARGPEWHGPCPVCGGRDRFHIWPEQGEGGTYWCRGCEQGGDLIAYYRWTEGLGYREACQRAGVEAKKYSEQSTPAARGGKNSTAPWQPVGQQSPVEIWAAHAAKFTEWCHLQLLANEQQLAWLAGRGITAAQVARFGLGWNPKDAYRQRESWGLAPAFKDNGQPRKLWLPMGLVIPVFAGDQPVDVRIRRPEGEPRYYVVPGSVKVPLVTRTDASAYVIVESGLDALLLDAVAGDLVGVVALGNSSIKPTAELHATLAKAAHLSICLDSDPVTVNQQTGKPQAAGPKDSRWWLAAYPQAERVPVIGGKDPGDAHKAGVDLRAWVLAGLPPRYHVAARKTVVGTGDAREQHSADESSTDKESLTVAQPPPVRILTLTDCREIHITADQQVWEALMAEGKIVFSDNELNRLQTATATMDAEEKALFVGQAVDAKQIFNGAYIRRGEVVA